MPLEPPEQIKIYCDSLIRLGHGSPIYEPDPGPFEHVQIGDVGYIDAYTGHFHRVFNAFHDTKSKINRFGLPDEFQPLSQTLQETVKGADLPSGAHCRHIKIDKNSGFAIGGTTIPAGAELKLSSSHEQGAMIVIKEPALRFNSACRELLAEALEKNYKNWLAFVQRRSPNLELRKMILVTGYDLASDWATATVDKGNGDVKISFKISDPSMQIVSVSTSMWGSWEYMSDVPVRFGPSASQIEQHLETGSRKNQCIFLRASRMARRGLKLKAAAGPQDVGSGGDDRASDGSSSPPILMNIDDSSDSEPNNDYEDVFDKAFTYLLKQTSEEFVLLHDNDVPEILEKISVLPDSIESSNSTDINEWYNSYSHRESEHYSSDSSFPNRTISEESASSATSSTSSATSSASARNDNYIHSLLTTSLSSYIYPNPKDSSLKSIHIHTESGPPSDMLQIQHDEIIKYDFEE